MPELPEVETTRRGIAPHIIDRKVTAVLVREPRLRWPVPDNLSQVLTGQTVTAVDRRAKYLLIQTGAGKLMVHLGMSGSLRIASPESEIRKHDHIDITFGDVILRYHDPRRFGSMHFLEGTSSHELIDHLGPEPLSEEFDGAYLYALSRGRKVAVKIFLMNAEVVVGVGNIYANEALYLAGIDPTREAGRVSRARYDRLVGHIKEVLQKAISSGGTTLRDFVKEDGTPGYFKQSLNVYGRGGEPCSHCGRKLREVRLGQRSTVYCTRCQG